MLRIIEVSSDKEMDQIRELFTEYVDWLGFDLGFQDFEREFRDLPGEYSPPDGCLLLATWNGETAGCVGLRKFEDKVCEMKRLYIRSEYRRKGMGRELSVRIIQKARDIGYECMRLDTVPWMTEALALYESMGFEYIEPYRHNPIEGAKFMELKLTKGAQK
jgi:ribosomal protein S18 acetylase RimI-like enzyme